MKWSFLLLLLFFTSCKQPLENSFELFLDKPNEIIRDEKVINFLTDTIISIEARDGLRIGEIQFLDVAYRKLVFFDRTNNEIDCFTINGGFINTIHLKKEFSSFNCNGLQIVNNDQLAILDRVSKKILIFSIEKGVIEKEFSFQSNPKYFLFNNDDQLYLYSPYPLNKYANSFQIQVKNLITGEDKFAYFKNVDPIALTLPIMNSYFGRIGKKVLFWDRYSNRINDAEDEQYSLLNFKMLRQKEYNKCIKSAIGRSYLFKNSCMVLNIINLNEFFFIRFIQKGKLVLCITNTTEKWSVIPDFNKNIDPSIYGVNINSKYGLNFWPDGSNAECHLLYHILEPSKLLNIFNSENNNFSKLVEEYKLNIKSNPLIRLVK